jgi:two-component system CheB/CheR fusion protein
MVTPKTLSQNKENTPSSAMNAPFPVVGIGASAGGLEAVGELLKNLPTDTGMAFIFVQHLAANHRSMLSEILSKKTTMQVAEAKHRQPVEPNHVYVIPPNVILTIVGGCLDLKPRNDALGIPAPIDDLFHSLAEDQGSNAIGISLSGAGTDGALGLQSIKSEGGVTFAQDDSAQYRSMPRAAIGLGCVDFILAPKEIARELVRISQHPPGEGPSTSDVESSDSNEANLKQIFQLLHTACNLDFTHYKYGTLKRRLARRMALQNFSTLASYIEFLNANPDEVRALGQDFLIRVTSFFRDPDTYESMSKYVLPRLINEHSSKSPLRIWVPGCSTGEEVYSLAICCLEYLAARNIGLQIQIFGTDVSESALQTARAGIYVENIARNVRPDRLEKFFVKTKDHYQVSRAVRDLCIFARHDVTSDPPYSRLDLVSCHNLLIYLDPVLQKRVLPLLHYALNPGGVLLLGPAESISGFSDIFTLVDNKKIKFYIKNPLPPGGQLKYLKKYPENFPSSSSSSSSSSSLYAVKKKYTDVELQKREADRITQGRYVPPSVLCDKNLNILEFRGDTSSYLNQPSGPPDTNLQKLLRPSLLVDITKSTQQAGKEGLPVRQSGVRVETPGGSKEITLEVVPIQRSAEEECGFLIFFEDKVQPELLTAETPDFWRGLGKLILRSLTPGKKGAQHRNNEDELGRLKRELSDTRDHIRIMIEEYDGAKEGLQASQEELLSSNEEFQSTNEELETAKEELQSANEELLTTNEEIRHRNNELSELNVKLEAALNYSDAIIKTVSQPFLVLDERLRVLRANPAFYKAFKTTPEATEQRLLYDLGDSQWDIPELSQFLQALVAKDTSFGNHEITHVFPNVGEKTMRLNGTHLVWEDHAQILLAIEDVTNYRKALNTLKDNDTRKDEFLAMLAHELRNPLAPLRNGLEIWKHGNAGPAAEQESQMIMERQLQKMVRLVDDLLDIARITRGSIALKMTPLIWRRSSDRRWKECSITSRRASINFHYHYRMRGYWSGAMQPALSRSFPTC